MRIKLHKNIGGTWQEMKNFKVKKNVANIGLDKHLLSYMCNFIGENEEVCSLKVTFELDGDRSLTYVGNSSIEVMMQESQNLSLKSNLDYSFCTRFKYVF